MKINYEYTREEYKKYILNPKQYFYEFINIKKSNVELEAVINEDKNNLNDMGPIQAIDNLTAVNIVINILEDNKK